jgi:hypothetical protein
MLPSRGVTYAIASYACAVTQFLGPVEIKVLSRVSRQDLLVTERIWDTSVALLGVSESHGGPGPGPGARSTYLDVLRQESGYNPVCYAYVMVKSLSMVKRALVLFSFRENISFGTWVTDGGPSYSAFAEVGITKTKFSLWQGGVTENTRGRLFLEPFRSRKYLRDDHVGLKMLFEMFVLGGSLIDYVCVHDACDAAKLIDFWYALGVSPRLTILCRSAEVAAIQQTSAFQRFQPAIIV